MVGDDAAATSGDVLRFVVWATNTGKSTANQTSIYVRYPAESLALVPGSCRMTLAHLKRAPRRCSDLLVGGSTGGPIFGTLSPGRQVQLSFDARVMTHEQSQVSARAFVDSLETSTQTDRVRLVLR